MTLTKIPTWRIYVIQTATDPQDMKQSRPAVYKMAKKWMRTLRGAGGAG